MEQLGKERRRKGFTMSEVLVVVVILAITLAIAIPAMIGGIRRMKLNRLDDSARSIFLAAQNSMTAMVGNGEFEHFADGVTDNEVVNLIGVGANPSDFVASHGDPADLRYLDSKNVDHEKALAELLPGGSIDKELEEHRYVVEYNCKTGAVYAVWYSDKKNFEDNSDAYTGEPREYDERLKNNPLIGYYGGSGVNYALVGQMPIPELTITNAEELRLHIKMPAALGGTGFLSGKIGLKVSVTGKTSNVSIPIIQRDDLVLLDEGKSADLMLDTLNEKLSDESIYSYKNQPSGGWKTGKAFKEWDDSYTEKLIPGEDISVTVTTYYADTDKLYLSQSATVNCNSLFARVEKKDDPDTSGTVEQIPTAIIAYGRHLQNLDALKATGDADGDIGTNGTDGDKIISAEQVKSIDFGATATDTIYSWKNTYTDESVDYVAIYNKSLTSYNGNSLPIRNLNAIENTDAYAGLFSHIEGSVGDLAKLKNITLINPAANAKNNAGALAGMVNNVNIKNCQVYLEGNYNPTSTPKITMTDTTTNRAGGLVGVADGNVNITDSFAAVVVEGNATCSDCDIGGLVGETSSGANLTIKKSYAACYLNGGSNGGNKAGGLVGNVDNSSSVSVSNSYADGIIINVKNGGTAAGLVTNAPSGGTLEIFNSYAAVRYSEEVAKTSSNVEIFGAAPNTSPLPGAGALSNNVYYVSQTGAKYVANSGKELNAKQLSEMPITAGGSGNFLGGDWYDKSGGTNPTYATFPYGQTDETKSLATPYPYPMLEDATGKDADGNPIPMFHYGDWLESETEEPAFESIMAYYDTVNSVTGYYAILNSEARINTLGSTGAAITDGYAVLSETELTDDNLKFTLNDDSTTQFSLTAGTKETIGSKEYYRHDLPKDAWTAAVNAATEAAKNNQNYYQKITLNGGQVLLFNPLFACEAVNGPYTKETPPADLPLATAQAKPGLTSKEAVDDGVVLRTPRHLANAAVLSADDTSVPPTGSTANDNPNPWRIKTYHQLLDIDYDVYKYVNNNSSVSFTDGTGTGTPQTPLLLGDKKKGSAPDEYNSIRGTYYGNTHVIRGAYIGSNDSARETSSSGATNNRDVAGLFGLVTNGSNVDGVRLVNAKVTTTNTIYVGAVAGKVAGTTSSFTDCGVYVEEGSKYNTYAVSSTKDKAFVGGFAGEFEGEANGCFAAIKVKATGKNSNAGGFVGTFKDATATDCYAGGHTENGKYTSDTDSVNVWVSGDGANAGGFAGSVTGKKILTLKGVCYTTCSVRNDKTTQESDEYKNTGCFVGLRPDSATSPKTEIKKATDATVYATGVAFKSNDVVNPRNETNYLTQLIPEMDGRSYTFTTTPYDSEMSATADYPYITNLTAHYGDWPTKHNLLYYEKYDKAPGTSGAVQVGSSWYGFYGKWNGTAGTQEVNSLAESGYAVDSGYALISDQDLGDSFLWGSETYGSSNGRTMVYNKAEVGKDNCAKLEKSSSSNLPAEYVYTLPFDALSQAPLDTYYRTISINGATTVCNPHFACEALNISNGNKVEVKLDDGRSYTYREFDMNKIQSKPDLMDGAANGDYEDCVLIRTPQHLASAARYTRQKNNLSSRVSSRGWAYHQLLDLDYSQYTGGIYDGNSGLRNKKKTNIAGKKEDYPQLAVTLGQKANSTSGDELDKTNVTSGSYNGHGHTIANLYAGISQESYVNSANPEDLYAGVFGWVYQSTIENIQLKNITVNVGTTSTGYDEDIKGTVLAIGGMAGRCSDSKVSGVTLEDVKINVGNDAKEAKNVGGLFGSIEGSSTNIKECGIRVSASTKYDNYGVVYNGKKTSYTGGFAGNVSDATVQNCYAAVKVTGYNCAGGFVGTFKDATVTDCYAGGHTVNGVYAPTAPNVTAKYENSSSTVGGFAGSVTNKVNFTGVNYSTCSVSCNTASAKRGRFVGNGTNNVEKGSNAILYGLAPAFRDGSAVVPTDEKAYLTGQLAAWKSSDNADATPYDTHWGKKYPYQVAKGQKIHYGDWMDLAEPSLVYYEEYATAGITPATTHITTNNGKFYGLGGSWKHADSSADEGIASLSNNAAESINEDGYALLWPVDESYSYTGKFPETLECTIKGTKVTFKRIVGDGTGFYENAIKLKDSYYYLYLPNAGTDLNSLFTYAGSDYYQTLTYNVTISEDGVSVSRTGERWFNPHFALEAYNTKPTDIDKPVVKQSNMLNSGNILGSGTEVSAAESAVIVRTARQFGNLADYAVSGRKLAKWSYHQTMDLHFDGTPFTETPVPFLGANGSYNGHSHRLTNLQVKVKDTTGNVGVFGQIDGATVQSVQLVNSEVDVENSGTSSETNVGGLVGMAKKGAKLDSITGINVRIKATGTDGNARVGGLFGRLQGESSAQVEVKNCGMYIDTALAPDDHDTIDGIGGEEGAYNYYSVETGASGNDYTGGLAGDVNQASLEKCYAAVKVTGYKYTGGLAGQLNGCTVTDCYAGGHTVGGEYEKPTNARTPAVNVTGLFSGAHVGGFTGQTADEVKFEGVCYTTCSVFAPNNNITNNTLGLFSGGNTGSNPNATGSTLYATGKAWAKDSASGFADATARSETEYDDNLLTERKQLLNVIVEEDNKDSKPYDSELFDNGATPVTSVPYIYKTNFDEHHGDWGLPDKTPVQSAGILYFEMGTDNKFTYQIAGVTSDGDLLSNSNADGAGFKNSVTSLDTLCVDRHMGAGGTIEEHDHIKTSGYVLFNGDKFRLTSPAKDTAGLTGTTDSDVCNKVLDILDVTDVNQLDELEVFVTPSTEVKGNSVNNMFSRRGYHSTEKPLYYTNGFAGVSDKAYSEGNPIAIRTVRQLDNIDNATLYFKQTHDLYGKDYPDYTGATKMQGGYDGDHRYILDLNMTGEKNVGLFSTTGSADLQNIILYSPDGKANITSTSDPSTPTSESARWGAGGLVGKVDGRTTKITNCVVAGYTIDGGSMIGGLVGYAYYNVNIKDCAAVNTLSGRDNDKGNVSIGGLLGGYHSYNTSDTLEIEESYAGGTVELTSTEGGNIIGGIVGKDYDDANKSKNNAVKNCYTYLDVTGVSANTTNANTIYAIGYGLSRDDSSGNAYRKDCLPTAATGLEVKTDDQGIDATNGTTLPGNTGAAAERSYVPKDQKGGDTTSTDGHSPMEKATPGVGYPYKAVVKDDKDKFVHYGDWPTK